MAQSTISPPTPLPRAPMRLELVYEDVADGIHVYETRRNGCWAQWSLFRLKVNLIYGLRALRSCSLCEYIYTCVYMHTCMNTCVYVCVYIHICTFVLSYVCNICPGPPSGIVQLTFICFWQRVGIVYLLAELWEALPARGICPA